MKVLIGAPVKQEHETLSFFLQSLEALDKGAAQVDYCFVDDNDDLKSTELLNEFAKKYTVTLLAGNKNQPYIKTEETHIWKEQNIWNVAAYKNRIIEEALQHQYDYILFVDSDLVLHTKTLTRLMECKKEIVSEIFWTKWVKGLEMEYPQVWMSDHYTLYKKERQEQITQEIANQRSLAFIEQLKIPGVYEVGGLGALTLIHRDALVKGVNFSEIKNVSFVGEDRHFCIRAAALGIPLYVDTHYPAYHMYRQEDVEKVKKGEVTL